MVIYVQVSTATYRGGVLDTCKLSSSMNGWCGQYSDMQRYVDDRSQLLWNSLIVCPTLPTHSSLSTIISDLMPPQYKEPVDDRGHHSVCPFPPSPCTLVSQYYTDQWFTSHKSLCLFYGDGSTPTKFYILNIHEWTIYVLTLVSNAWHEIPLSK